jgi:glutathione synthase/RimK-type ligase-like ATP-grasp enzyme
VLQGDARVVFAVDRRTVDLTSGDRVLADAIRARGVDVQSVVWDAPCDPGDVVVIRSTWDYAERPGEFRSWLDELDAAGITVVNPTQMLRWNMHKCYLAELAACAVPVVPTAMIRRGSGTSLRTLMSTRGWTRAVVKPAIGASARETFRVEGAGLDAAEERFRRLVETDDVLVQPFLSTIETDGEISVVAIGGEITHTVSKRPASGEWRVQSEHGGSVERVTVTAQHVDAVTGVLEALDRIPAYARVDLAVIDGVLHLMELELIEPELFFELAPEAADRLSALLVQLSW